MTNREKEYVRPMEEKAIKAIQGLGLQIGPYKLHIDKWLGHAGLCYGPNQYHRVYEIYLHRQLFEPDQKEKLQSTITHEILHTCKPYHLFMCHGKTFIQYERALMDLGLIEPGPQDYDEKDKD
jgi:hypothetical protein